MNIMWIAALLILLFAVSTAVVLLAIGFITKQSAKERAKEEADKE